MNELLKLGAVELAQKIHDREISAVEAVQAHIDRVEEVNADLNAVVEKRFDAALNEARLADGRLLRDPENLPPLLGVPFTSKEVFAVKGMKRTAGSIYRRDARVDYDATVVARLRAAGGIPIGTTNVPELGFWFETDNPIYGRTSNPYDTKRTAGGSSGGEAAIIASGGSPFGIGSDIGGSNRVPATFCGIFGHKPSNRALSLSGHFPYTSEDLKSVAAKNYPYTTVGVLARKAGDLRPLFNIMKGADPSDPHVNPDFSVEEIAEDASTWKVYVCEAPRFHLGVDVKPKVREAVRNAARYFEAMGATVEELNPRFFIRGVEWWGAAIRSSSESDTFESMLSPDNDVTVAAELAKSFFGKARHSVPSLMALAVERLSPGASKDATESLRHLEASRQALAKKLSGRAILIVPAFPDVAPKHRGTWKMPFEFIHTGVYNALGFPATAVPVGLDEQGLPLGVQVVAAAGHDGMSIRAAQILESAFGGWQPPSI